MAGDRQGQPANKNC